MKILPLSALFGLLGTVVQAEAPRVAVDIAPVHSLVAQVMEGVGNPDLLMRPGVSPHTYALRPSEARALQDADVVFWIGPELTPALDHSIETLSSGALVVGLLDLEVTQTYQFRDPQDFELAAHAEHNEHENHDSHEDHGSHDDHDDHDSHDDHAHADDHKDDHDDRDKAEDHGHAHDHDGVDPHAWLDPKNAAVWLSEIALVMSQVDPANSDLYVRNANAATAELADLEAKVETALAAVKGEEFVVFHDAYQYFEKRYGMVAVGAL